MSTMLTHGRSSEKEISDNSISLPSPPLDGPLTDAFPSIHQWYQLESRSPNHSTSSKESKNDGNYWRNTTRKANVRTTSDSNIVLAPRKQLKKVAHNVIEKRYRNNINDRIHELKNAVPALYKARISSGSGKFNHHDKDEDDFSDSETEIVDGVEVAKKLNKATILKKATEYIHFLKTTNEKADKENLILQQIVAQMPGGQEVLSRFLYQKAEFEKSEAERLARERRDAQEKERIERQKLLRERAAERAALAQLLPKSERKPYRRRQSRKLSGKSKDSSGDETSSGNNKMLMAAFMCFVFFTTSPYNTSQLQYHDSLEYSDVGSVSHQIGLYRGHLQHTIAYRFWPVVYYMLYAFGIFYICLIPLAYHWLQPRPIKKSKKCLDHCHYSNEVPIAWRRLYLNLVQRVNKFSASVTLKYNSDVNSTISTMLDTITNLLYVLVPCSVIKSFRKKFKATSNIRELSDVNAKIRLNEVECLGGNPNITRLSMLHSSIDMLTQLHEIKCTSNYISFYGYEIIARAHATIALQLELCSIPFISSYLAPYHWTKALELLSRKLEQAEKDAQTSNRLTTNQWSNSEWHNQVLRMLTARNGFNSCSCISLDILRTSNKRICRNILYSFVLPYIISPLDLELYWQQLNSLKHCWLAYLDGVHPVFSEGQLNQMLSVSVTTTASSYMLQWWVRVGLALESLHKEQQENMDILSEYARMKTKAIIVNSHSSFNLLQRYQIMMYSLIEATRSLVQNNELDKVPFLFERVIQHWNASKKCIRQIASTNPILDPSSNCEANVFALATLAVNTRALKELLIYQSSISRSQPMPLYFSNIQISTYIVHVRGQILHDLDSPYAKILSTKRKNRIQLLICQADNALSL
ncbi:hypothetical protein RO3G_06752 [Rhizopus delemar RA 99-880]|uniref:BHLH domain-containing protein n=3 Tax=Rhizopus TaxID=4842 RepID=I1C0R7_RHIO9|nr:hypothetical protein RO3G_06752 [Rhizopus delemar RA 99-880]|eukprot:EIE82047.1 hypothetical protein RO3G_06752 [Rhizopus delemar RA 99-880]